MGYRDELIRRLKESGEWGKGRPEYWGQMEQIDDETARQYMAILDGMEAPDGYLDDNETSILALAFLVSASQSIVKAFDGKLVERDASGKFRPSELGHALLAFAAVAKDHGFASDTAIAGQLSSVTWEGLRSLQKLSEQS